MEEANFNEFILANMPSFIAVNYQRLLEAQKPQERVNLILHIYNLSLRVLTIILVCQYIFHDLVSIRDPYLDKLLQQKFPHLTSDAWEEMLFTILRAYEGHRDLFLMPELYDFYWDTSTSHQSGRAEVKPPFDRLTQATLEQQTQRLLPQDTSGWQALATELLAHLHKILESLSFIGQYDFIHVLTQDEHTYTFTLHKGNRILTQQESLTQPIRLTSGWFYLRAGTEDFLRLYPLLVFWEDSTEPTDTGVFDRRIHEQLRYLLATPGHTRLDEKGARDFVKLIYLTIQEAAEEHEQAKQKAETLTWVQLCDICKNITEHRLISVPGKYHPELYLQRDTVRQHVEAFLADRAKRGFVLVGKSGVGKSNFLLALAQELQQSRDDVCVLMYDGANLPIASSSFTEIISQDFSDHVLLSSQPVHQVWHEIAKIEEIDERQVIICVDAINENPQASELLRQLDALVRSRWPWLKVILSSRPETWKEIKRGVKLAEPLYYQRPGTEVVGIELEPFSYSVQMEPFSRQELPEVYSKYQREFHLQTPYLALTHELREMLRDPLNLRLLASTYRGKDIPSHVKTSSLIELYVNSVLQREERRFVEQQLVPLMVGEGHYSNMITEAELDAAGGGLYELVYSQQVLSDGRKMNQSFLNVCDADILVLQEQETQQWIAFKYERFYDYFAGKRIVSLSKIPTDRFVFYLSLIEQTTRTPFLWGVVSNALVEEAKTPGSEKILQLCRTEQQRVKEMMVSVLITLGLDAPEVVEGILKYLIPPEKQASEVQKLLQMIGKSAKVTHLRTHNSRKITIEVASTLKLIWILKTAALQTDPTMRTVAVRYSYYLWQRDQAAGFAILDYLAQQATVGLIPHFAAFESVVGLSVIIFCDHYQDERVLSRLQGIWREMIAQLFRLREGSSLWKGVVQDFIRERIISFTIALVSGLFRELPTNNMVSYQSLEAFFQLGRVEKALFRNLVHYFEVDGEYSRAQMVYDYLTVLQIDNVLVSLATLIGLVAHACSAPLAFLPFLKRLFEAAKRDVASYPYLTVIANVAMNVLERHPMLDEVFDFFVYTAEVCQEYYAKHPETYHSRLAEAPQAFAIGTYILLQYRRAYTVRTAWLEARIQKALFQHHLKFFELLLTAELPLVGLDHREPRAALAALELFFQSDDTKINHMIQAFLSRLRIYYPDEVDDFLDEQHAPEEFRLQVRTHEPIETVGELIGLKSWSFVRDDVLLGSSELRSQFIDLFEKAADCKDTQTWMDYMIRRLVNPIYGGEALHLSE